MYAFWGYIFIIGISQIIDTKHEYMLYTKDYVCFYDSFTGSINHKHWDSVVLCG